MELEYHSSVNRHATGGGGGGGESLSNNSSSDRNHSSSSNSISNHRPNHHNQEDPMQSWWESVSKARSCIHSLLSLIPSHSESLSSLADSDRPARSLLDSFDAYSAVSTALSSPLSGSGDDPLCQWLYDTFHQHSQSSDLRLVVLSFVPLLAGLYLSRIHSFPTTSPSSPSLAGFEAVLLALYASETKSRAGKPLLVSIPTPSHLSQHPSLYHHPNSNSKPMGVGVSVGVISPPLEPQVGIKSTKRACIVGVAFHCFYRHISQMPPWSKLDLCRFAASWAGHDCPCPLSLEFTSNPNRHDDVCVDDDDDYDDDVDSSNAQQDHIRLLPPSEEMTQLEINGNQAPIPLPWELLQPLLRILGHCLLGPLNNSNDMKDAASVAVRRLYARASHDLVPQGILATRSLVQLDNRARAAAKAAALTTASSNVTTPRPPKQPEVLLVSK